MNPNVNVAKLRGKIVELGMTISDVAEKMGIDRSTLYRKLEGNGETLLVRDANALVRILNLSSEEAVAIFFSQFVA